MTTRGEHLAWCKQRALEYVDRGDIFAGAVASMTSDLRKHPDTAGHPAIVEMTLLVMAGGLSTPLEVRDYIEGLR